MTENGVKCLTVT